MSLKGTYRELWGNEPLEELFMENKKKCPIDQTVLTTFNQYELQDGTICRGCAKKIGLTGAHQSTTLANAAKALLTLAMAKEYLSEGKKIDYTELKKEYKSEVKSGDAPSGYQMFKSTINDAGNKNNNITNIKEPKNDATKIDKSTGTTKKETGKKTKVKNDVPTSTVEHLSDDKTTMCTQKEEATDTHEDNSQCQFNEDKVQNKSTTIASNSKIENTQTNPVKKGPLFWKGSGINGFLTGALAGLVVGIINMGFIHFGHLGLIVWIVVWIFMGTNPRYKEKRTDAQIHQEAEDARQRVQDKDNSSTPQTIIINNQAEKKAKRPIFGGLVCPKCHSANVQLIATDANIKKTKTHVTADLNPLHPLRIANVKQKKVKKHSAAKTTAAMMTMGVSTVVTGGTRSNKSREYHCQDCGKVFYKK